MTTVTAIGQLGTALGTQAAQLGLDIDGFLLSPTFLSTLASAISLFLVELLGFLFFGGAAPG